MPRNSKGQFVKKNDQSAESGDSASEAARPPKKRIGMHNVRYDEFVALGVRLPHDAE